MKFKLGFPALLAACAVLFFSCDPFVNDQNDGGISDENFEDESEFHPEGTIFFDFNTGEWDGWELSKATTTGPFPEIIYEDAEHGYVVNFDARNSRVGQNATISNTFTLQEKTEFRFLVKSNIITSSALVLYINNEEVASYNGTNRPWVVESFILDAGIQKISFTMERETNSYSTGATVTNSVRLDNIVLRPSKIEETFIDDFEFSSNAALHASLWYGGAIVTTAEKETDSLYFGNDTKFIKLQRVSNGSTFLKQRVNVKEPSALTFNFRAAIRTSIGQNFKVYVDDEEKGSYARNSIDVLWRTETILLDPGIQTITFEFSSGGSTTSGGLNAVYIDNIGFVPDVTDSVVLYPRGNLDTYVGVPENEKIKFRAQALRSDGSIRQNAQGFTFSSGINSQGIFTPPAAGNIDVSVSIDGKSTNKIVTVHPENYLRLPYTYPGTGKTYNGFAGTEGTRITGSGAVTVTYPSETAFDADGFITVEGSVNNDLQNYAYIRMFKTADETNTLTTYYVKDNFKQRVWLRHGPGEYTVNVHNLASITINSENYISGNSRQGNPVSFIVTNTANDGISIDGVTPDKRFIYPSYIIQSDDFRITNLASDLIYGLTDDTAKIKAIHDYICINTVYDYSSVDEMRRRQDALTVLETRHNADLEYPNGHFFAVCEGYTNAFAAIARAAGFETRYISSSEMNHAWNNIYTGGRWKFLDATWNDVNPIRYTYFLLDNLSGSDGSHAKSDAAINNTRNAVSIPQWDGHEGWY